MNHGQPVLKRVKDKQMGTHERHATVLHLLGLDHERLTYKYAGRDFRLTDVAGEVAKDNTDTADSNSPYGPQRSA
jgi:hypothetical protein